MPAVTGFAHRGQVVEPASLSGVRLEDGGRGGAATDRPGCSIIVAGIDDADWNACPVPVAA